MSELSDAAAVAKDPAFRDLIAAQLVRSALNVYAEDDSTEDHVNRARLAVRILQAPGESHDVVVFAWAATSNPAVVNKWMDEDYDGVASDLAYVISSVWDAVADSDAVAVQP